jgi:hypothetical protein
MFFAVCQSRDISSSERADHELVCTIPGSSHCILPKVQLNLFRTFPNLSKLCDSFARPAETMARQGMHWIDILSACCSASTCSRSCVQCNTWKFSRWTALVQILLRNFFFLPLLLDSSRQQLWLSLVIDSCPQLLLLDSCPQLLLLLQDSFPQLLRLLAA